jgi:hypothetical protein
LVSTVRTTINLSSCNPQDTGTVTQTFVSQQGCDSIVTTITTLLPSYNITVNGTTCDPAQAGTVVQNLTTIDGCDSIVTTITTLVSTIRTTINLSSCNPADTGTVIQFFTSQQGCDSIVTTITTILPRIEIEIFDTTCNANNAGVFIDSLISINGCDSIITTHVFLKTVIFDTIFDTACNRLNYLVPVPDICIFLISGQPIPSGNYYSCNYYDIENCDTVTVLSLFVPPLDTIEKVDTICGFFVFPPTLLPYNGPLPNILGYLESIITNTSNNCDSILLHQLFYGDGYSRISIYPSICKGDTFVFNNINYFSEGIFIDTVPAEPNLPNDCPDIYSIYLSLKETFSSQIDTTICQGDNVEICGNLFNATGTHTIICTASNGCDSTITLNLIVNPLVNISNVTTTCSITGLNYWVSFDIIGSGPFTVTGGLGSISGNTFTSNPIAVNSSYNFVVSDNNNCNSLEVSGVAPNCVTPCSTPNCGKVKVIKN